MSDLLDIIFPIHCYICDEIVASKGLCADCWSKIEFLSRYRCDSCGFQFQGEITGPCAKCVSGDVPLDKLHACIKYNGSSKALIMKFKNFAHTEILDFFMPLIMYEIRDTHIDCVIPVPLHWVRQIWRGYNQAAIIAQKIATELHKPHDSHSLARIRFTQPNVRKLAARKNKVLGAFVAKGEVKNKHVLLVDDVYTTGATMRECARVLKEAGAATVIGLALCQN